MGLSRAGGFWEDLEEVMQMQWEEELPRQRLQQGGKNIAQCTGELQGGVAGACRQKQRGLSRGEANNVNRSQTMGAI